MPSSSCPDVFATEQLRGFEPKTVTDLRTCTAGVGKTRLAHHVATSWRRAEIRPASLAFTSHLAMQLGDAAFALPGLQVEVGLVVFVPTNLPAAERDRSVAETDRYLKGRGAALTAASLSSGPPGTKRASRRCGGSRSSGAEGSRTPDL